MKIPKYMKYILVQWPESQMLSEEPWYKECFFIDDEDKVKVFGPQAFFVPEERFNEWILRIENM